MPTFDEEANAAEGKRLAAAAAAAAMFAVLGLSFAFRCTQCVIQGAAGWRVPVLLLCGGAHRNHEKM